MDFSLAIIHESNNLMIDTKLLFRIILGINLNIFLFKYIYILLFND